MTSHAPTLGDVERSVQKRLLELCNTVHLNLTYFMPWVQIISRMTGQPAGKVLRGFAADIGRGVPT